LACDRAKPARNTADFPEAVTAMVCRPLGRTGDYERILPSLPSGPDGIAIFGGDIFAGNSHVLGLSLRAGQEVADINTGGKLRADEMGAQPASASTFAGDRAKPTSQ
jgi:hypothetical protein